jgi:hypothetical protein
LGHPSLFLVNNCTRIPDLLFEAIIGGEIERNRTDAREKGELAGANERKNVWRNREPQHGSWMIREIDGW